MFKSSENRGKPPQLPLYFRKFVDVQGDEYENQERPDNQKVLKSKRGFDFNSR